MPPLHRLWEFVRPYSVALGLTFVAAVVASVLDGFTFALLIPFLRLMFGGSAGLAADTPTAVERILSLVVGFALEHDRGAALRNVVVLMLVAVGIKNVAVYAAGTLGARVQEGAARDLRGRAYAHLQRLRLDSLHHLRGGHLVSRLVSDIDQSCQLVSQALVSAGQNAMLAAVYLAILFSLSWRLALVMLLIAPLITLLMRPILRRVRGRTRAAIDGRADVTAVLSETIEGARLVKAHRAEAYERQRFGEAADRYYQGAVGARRFAVLAHPVSETLGAGVLLLLLIVGVSRGGGAPEMIRPELFIPFVAIALRLLSPARALSQFPATAVMSLAAAERVFELLEQPMEDVDRPGALEFSGVDGDIVFQNVWFGYEPDRWVLRGVDLHVRVGEVVAIVGPSGAGKSTLVDLLPRFVDPDRGAVLLDGVPTMRYSRRSLRAAMGIVSQHTVIFNDTVSANIAYGDLAGASRAAVEDAARAANAHDFITRLPDGYDTFLGERGMRLSGGERQRLAIARALLKDPPILILDEATSALDAEAERLVQQAIDRLLERRTVLVIAHRLSTVIRADTIAVLERGLVVEVGRHDDLIAAGGPYQRLHGLDIAAAFR